jgi:4-amino-4-deoxy-L-arabinose transferase-like glycosyltransferase
MSTIPAFLHKFFLRDNFPFRKLFIITLPLLATVVVIWKFFIVFQAPFRLDYAEGFIFTNTMSIFRGMPIYHSVESAPYIFGFYTPLFNYIGALFFKLFCPSILVLRVISFIFYLATGVSVGYIIKLVTKNLFAAVLSAFLFYSAFIVSQWSSIARPDMLGIFFISFGIAVGMTKFKKNTTRIILAAFIFSLAFFSKQSFVFAPLAFFLSSLFQNKKEAWSFAGAYAFFVVVCVGLLHIWTHGEFTRQIFVYTSLVPYGNLYTAFRIAAITGISALPLLIIAIKKFFQDPKSFFSIYFLCSLLTFCMLLRDGGIQNYLLEFILALILLAIVGVRWEKICTYPARRLYPLLVPVIFFFFLWSYTSFPWETKIYVTERQDVFQKEISMIKNGSKILVEDPLVAYATHSTVELDPYTYGQIADSGSISKNKLFTDVRNAKYTYIDDYGAFDRVPGFMDVVNENFRTILLLSFLKPIKPFDYSLYNRNTVTDTGTLYMYVPGKAAVDD